MGAGLCFGPLIGSLVYNWLNYVQTFYFFAAYMLTFGAITAYFIPAHVNRTQSIIINEGGTQVENGIPYS